MPINPATGLWQPHLSHKQLEIFNSDSRYLLVSGPRMSGKSRGCLHKLVRHMWELDGSRVAMFARTTKTAIAGGSWKTLEEIIIAEWLQANIVSEHGYRFRYITEPKVEGSTRTHTFTLQNYYGGKSECYLFSLDHCSDVESKVKNLEFSAIYFVELSNFEDRIVFDISKVQLRLMPKVPFNRHVWIGDTNPSDRGQDSWIYKLWYERTEGDEKEAAFKSHLRVVSVYIEDNPFLTKEEVDDLKSSYAHDPDLYARYIDGKWVRATEKGFFTGLFLPNTHVHGDTTAVDKAKWQIIVPDEKCIELSAGFDLGQINHSAHIACKRIVGDQLIYDVIDELVCLDEKISIAEFTDGFMDKMDFWEKFLLDTYGTKKIRWRCWSDSSAFSYRSSSDSSEEKIVLSVSSGRINLLGVNKPYGSIRKRVDLVKRLLFENRLFISAQCRFTIEMLNSIRPGSSVAKYIHDDGRSKHILDSLTYMLVSEEGIQIDQSLPRVSSAKNSALISVPV